MFSVGVSAVYAVYVVYVVYVAPAGAFAEESIWLFACFSCILEMLK